MQSHASKKKGPQHKASVAVAIAMVAIAVIEVGLSIYQWAELAALARGENPVCAINATFNCATVWTSELANGIHRAFGVPVAGLGLMWGLLALVVSALLLRAVRSEGGDEAGTYVFAARVLGVLAIVAILVLGSESVRIHTVCLTCLGTYALSLAFAVLAWRVSDRPLRPVPHDFREGLKWVLGGGLAAYVVVLVAAQVGPQTMVGEGAKELASTATATPQAGANATDEQKLQSYLHGLPLEERQMLSNVLAYYRVAPKRDSRHPPHTRYGPADAPVQIVEFTDIRCGHCRNLSETMRILKRVVPPGSISVEPRYYPLDSECNPKLQGSDNAHVRCLGAKVQICLEQAPDFWDLRERMFDEQNTLVNPERVMELASSGSVSRSKLEECVKSPATEARLKEDIAYAEEYGLTGTPLVLLNGKEGPPIPSFLYAMAMTKGNPDAPVFKDLPPPSMEHPE